MKILPSIPTDTTNLELLVQAKSSTSPECPKSGAFCDHLITFYELCMYLVFSLFSQMVTDLSSEPEAINAPFGENFTTFTLLEASESPYKILIFNDLSPFVISHILIHPSVPYLSSSVHFF